MAANKLFKNTNTKSWIMHDVSELTHKKGHQGKIVVPNYLIEKPRSKKKSIKSLLR